MGKVFEAASEVRPEKASNAAHDGDERHSPGGCPARKRAREQGPEGAQRAPIAYRGERHRTQRRPEAGRDGCPAEAEDAEQQASDDVQAALAHAIA